MSGNNLSVKITADVVDLQAKFAVAKAEVGGLTSEMNKLAKQSAAGIIDPAGEARLQQVAEDFLHAKETASQLSEELKKSSASFKEAGEAAGGVGGALEEIQSKISTAFQVTGIAAAYEAIEKVGETIERLGERATQMRAMSEVLDVTTAQFQTMQSAAEEGGTSIEVLARAGEKLISVMTSAREGSAAAVEKLLALGVSTAQIADPTFKLNDLMAILHDRLNDTSTSQDTMNQLIKEFGARAALAAEGIKAYDGSAEGVSEKIAGLNGLTDEQIQKLHEANVWWKELGVTITNTASKALIAGTALLPHVTGDNSTSKRAKQDAAEDQSGQRQQEDVAREMLQQEMDNAKAGVEAYKQGTAERLAQMKVYAAAAEQYLGSSTVDVVVKANNAIIGEERAVSDALIAEDRKTAAARLSSLQDVNRAMADQARIKTEMVNKSLAESARELAGAKKDQEAELEAARASVLGQLQIQKAQLDAKKSSGGIGASAGAAEERAIIAQELQAWEQFYAAKARLANGDAAELAKINAQRLQIETKFSVDAIKADQAATTKIDSQWKTLTQSLTSGMDGAFKKMATGAQSFGQGLRSIFASAADGVIGSFAHMAAANISTMLQQAVVGNTLRAQEIKKDAGAAAAGAYKAIVGIPYVGPFLAPAAAAVAYAGVLAFDSAEGGYDIPSGLNPMTQLHEREMVLPRAQADVVRNLAKNGGGDSGAGGVVHHHNWNISALDGHSVKRMLNDPSHRRMFSRAVGAQSGV